MRSLFHALTRSCSTSAPDATRLQLRALLRDTAQPVAVVTSYMPSNASSSDNANVFHGATLSSFTSIAMDPVPLVTFALRIPSRMASALNSSQSNAPSDMVINILSAQQASIATSFSRPDLYPHPFSSTPYFLNPDGLPVIRGSLGALSCKLVSRGLPLHDLRLLRERRFDETPLELPLDVKSQTQAQVVSELFIAQVTRVEELEPLPAGQDLPLLYHRRSFTSCIPADASTRKLT